MLYLTVNTGDQRGASWLIKETAVTVGRSSECEIRVIDPVISRRHCEVWLAEGRVHVRDLGSSNATLVNGRPIREAVLQPGDELAVGSTTFVVTAREMDDGLAEKGKDSGAVTVAVRNGVYTCDASPVGRLRADPRTIHELYDLFALGRVLGEASALHELIPLVEMALIEHFQPESLWISTFQKEGDELLFQPGEHCGPSGEAPLEAMKRATREHLGMLVPKLRSAGAEQAGETVMVLPLMHAVDCVGCMALRGRTPGRLYTEGDLEFALGVAATTAPHLRAVRNAEQIRRDTELQRLGSVTSGQLLGDSPPMREVRGLVRRAAGVRMNVLVLGETGTGKELAARLIHGLSPRASGPYVALNCAAIPKELFESEMFGHEKGAFTGASQTRIGCFEEAHGGTLLLDEVGDMAPENQARLLRTVETGVFRRVGGTRDIAVDVRIVAATNRALAPELFRTDLFHRLNGLTITMPPLRGHIEDLPLLTCHFLQRFSPQVPGGAKNVSPEALRNLSTYNWPGNIRELKAAIERAVMFCDGPDLGPQHFPISASTAGDSAAPYQLLSLAEVERRHIVAVLHSSQGNVSAAARILGINRVTLYKRIAAYDI